MARQEENFYRFFDNVRHENVLYTCLFLICSPNSSSSHTLRSRPWKTSDSQCYIVKLSLSLSYYRREFLIYHIHCTIAVNRFFIHSATSSTSRFSSLIIEHNMKNITFMLFFLLYFPSAILFIFLNSTRARHDCFQLCTWVCFRTVWTFIAIRHLFMTCEPLLFFHFFPPFTPLSNDIQLNGWKTLNETLLDKKEAFPLKRKKKSKKLLNDFHCYRHWIFFFLIEGEQFLRRRTNDTKNKKRGGKKMFVTLK